MLNYVTVLEERYDSLISCKVFFKRKIITYSHRSAVSDGGIALKMGRVIPGLLCERVSSAEVGMCLEWGGKPKLTYM